MVVGETARSVVVVVVVVGRLRQAGRAEAVRRAGRLWLR